MRAKQFITAFLQKKQLNGPVKWLWLLVAQDSDSNGETKSKLTTNNRIPHQHTDLNAKNSI
jgi:hypothetical protein